MDRDSKSLERFKSELESNRQEIHQRRESVRVESGRLVPKERSRWLQRAATLRYVTRNA